MKKITLLFILLISFSCSSLKRAEKAINSGNYEQAISLSIKKLAKNKFKEKNQPYVIMLQNAFVKATDRDLSKISYLKKENNPANLEAIYTHYRFLKNRQEKIKPLLPLKDVSTGKNINFNFVNYDDKIVQAKENYINSLYKNGIALLKLGKRNKMNYRDAFDAFVHLNKISPNYKNTQELIDKAHIEGTDYVYLSINNETNQIIPRRLEDDLLAIDTYGLNDLWTVYHSRKNKQIKYDFDLELNLRTINISPEKINEKQIIQEKEVEDGFEYLKNSKREYVKDSLGARIKVAKFKTIRCQLYRFEQFKSSRIIGLVKYFENSSNQLLESFPIESEFVFEHIYADYDGDISALETSFFELTKLQPVNFPSNEEMIYDTGADLKNKLKHIITRNKFRN